MVAAGEKILNRKSGGLAFRRSASLCSSASSVAFYNDQRTTIYEQQKRIPFNLAIENESVKSEKGVFPVE